MRESGGTLTLNSELSTLNAPVRLHPPVAEAVHGVDPRESRVALFELASQSLDVAVDRALGDPGVVGVRLLHQLLACLDVARVAREGLQQQELRDRQRQGLPPPAGRVAQAV